ncbi:MAG: hypothetical protein OEL77_04995 [Nitrosopumilus sp.]|nr:hypothetical protein [Nitrosopumilus sp.]MDH3385350.1 hypothetical protein [Nitrosopumilus sp.]
MHSSIPKITNRWWYSLPIFLGLVGGIIVWFALKSFDRKLTKNCLTLGISLDLFKIMIIVGLVIAGNNLNLNTGFETISETSDFDFQFKFNSP